MKGFKKYLQMIFMIIPMVMLMLHDMIPHHHHDLEEHDGHQTIHTHHKHHKHHHHHNKHHDDSEHEHDFHLNLADHEFITCFTHHHDEAEETCCFLTHHRVKKQAKSQVFLKENSVNYNINEKFCRKRYIVCNDRLLPDRTVPINQLRGPPSSALPLLG
jgi:hypothetical protein